MFAQIFISLYVLKTASAQINGEFWWLHDKVTQLQNVEPSPPNFDDVNEFETDETVKIVFKDTELYSMEDEKANPQENDLFLNRDEEFPAAVIFRDQTKLAKPINFERDIVINEDHNLKNVSAYQKNKTVYMNHQPLINNFNKSQNNEDQFTFSFPASDFSESEIDDDNNTVSQKPLNDTKHGNTESKKIKLNDKIWFEEDKKPSETESICTFLNKRECARYNGVEHMPGIKSCLKNTIPDLKKICCILPLPSNRLQKFNGIHFDYVKRFKRSEPNEKLNSALKQRNALLFRKFKSQAQKSKPAATTMRTNPTQKIVTPVEYIDPYWNIKNSKFRNPAVQSSSYQDYQNTKYDENQDYVEDYAAELPKPGLVGLYSDHDQPHTWKLIDKNKGFSYGGNVEVIEEDNGDGDYPFGYSTIDPRLGDRIGGGIPKPIRRRPQQSITPSPDHESMENSESYRINFHSTPDFHVLQGFKLKNLAGNKNRYVRKITTESCHTSEEDAIDTHPPQLLADPSIDYEDNIDLDQQVYKNCGKSVKNVLSSSDFGKNAPENKCDPWLAFVVLTKSRQSILCYATIVHQRAAVTAADCVHGKSPGEITILAGISDLKEEHTESQQRLASVHLHPEYSPGDLANSIALLHWKRPLKMDLKVQAACLDDPHVGDDCYFVGWSGYDQALKPRPHWQRASILTPRSCNEKVSAPDIELPTGAFCASVQTRGTVTGLGGPLLCKNSDRVSAVGVAVWRENVVILMPTFEWTTIALRDLQIII